LRKGVPGFIGEQTNLVHHQAHPQAGRCLFSQHPSDFLRPDPIIKGQVNHRDYGLGRLQFIQ
jgi:hypothetical protein